MRPPGQLANAISSRKGTRGHESGNPCRWSQAAGDHSRWRRGRATQPINHRDWFFVVLQQQTQFAGRVATNENYIHPRTAAWLTRAILVGVCLLMSACVFVNSSTIGGTTGSGSPISATHSDYGILHLSKPDGLTRRLTRTCAISARVAC